MRTRHGFTLLELLVVMLLGTLMLGIVAPGISRSLAQSRVQRAASVVAADLQLARSLAARQRAPVQVSILEHSRIVRVHRGSMAAVDTVFSERRFDRTSEYPMQSLTATASEVVFYPNGLSNGQVIVTVQAAGNSRQVKMSRGGHVRIQ
jgi:type II secretion system protein H